VRYRLNLVKDRLCSLSWSDSTAALLESLALDDLVRQNPRGAFFRLEQDAADGPHDARQLLALAELADEIARSFPPRSPESIDWSRDAAVYAVFCLTELEGIQPGASTACMAQEIHNRALTRCLRGAQKHVTPCRATADWPARLGAAGILLTSTVPTWSAFHFDTLEPSREFAILGPRTSDSHDGLGVPLIARRVLLDAELTVWKPYGPRDAVFAATAVLQPRGSVATWRQEPVELVLHDPVGSETIGIGGRSLPLASDLTTPLIRRLAQSPMQGYELTGAINADAYSARAGVYAVDTYQPGKIPVVLVHGLWSSPLVWMPMLDTLRSDPVVRARYQFWVALYPSGYPLPVAALSLRRSLREIRQKFDPSKIDPALDQMVILGKSTGGQLTRMLVQPGGDLLWSAVFAQPINELDATPALLAELRAMFYFQPEPYVRRVIFVTTGHRGSRMSGNPALRLGVTLIRRENPFRSIEATVEAANGRSAFQPFFQNRTLSSIDGTEANNPLLLAIDAQPIAPEVAYHSIIANIRPNAPPERMNDGLVSYSSAHLDGVASEYIVSSSHRCEANREFITEVRRILHVNLAEQNPRRTADQNAVPEAAVNSRQNHGLPE
jgi:triacylglycerol esterase/lipase EstA (alpha/beta hydrolase family)